jgi:hypothetical protein
MSKRLDIWPIFSVRANNAATSLGARLPTANGPPGDG